MNVTNILNDGTETEDLEGHIVRTDASPEAYKTVQEGEKDEL